MKFFASLVLAGSVFTYHTLIPSATGAPPPVGSSGVPETAIRPGSIISGYPIPPPYTLTRYDEDYSYLANPANRTEALDVIKYIPLFNWGPSYFVTLGVIFVSSMSSSKTTTSDWGP
jgi:hypothetical protein